jgi:AraC-like DNA-binding protein
MAAVTAMGAPRAFTTAGVPPRQQVEAWQAHNSEALLGLRCRTLGSSGFDGTTVNIQLAHTHLARLSAGTAHVIERRPELIGRCPADSIVLFFGLTGEAFFYHEDGVRTLSPGQLVGCDSDQPFMRGFSPGYQELVLKVRRDAFRQRTGLERLDRPLFIGFAHDHNAVARSLAVQVGAAARLNGPRQPDEDELLGLVGALLVRSRDAHPSAYLTAAHAFVDARLSDTSLSATTIASAVGISSRHLSRIFSRAGTTVPHYVLGRRLDAARAMLQRPETAALTVTEVASRCGFTSAAYFSTSFAARFAERASEVRRRAHQQHSIEMAHGAPGA